MSEREDLTFSAATRSRPASSTASASGPSASATWGGLRAGELRLAPPFEAPTRERLEADLRRVRARLN
jgi:hypothetical protein